NVVRRWWLRRRLRRAARLVSRGILTPTQYAAVAVKDGSRLHGVTVALGDVVEHFDFTLRVMEHLADDPSNEGSMRESVAVYGPYLEAVYTLQEVIPAWLASDRGRRDSVEWKAEVEHEYRGARRRMSPIARAALAFEAWHKEQTELFPILSG